MKSLFKYDLSFRKIGIAAIKQKLPLMVVIFFASCLVAVTTVIYNKIFYIGAKLAKERFAESHAIIFLVVPTLFLISAYLCKRFAKNAAGSGTSHVLSALRKLSTHETRNGDVEEYLSLKIAVIAFISSIICVFGGGALGREGPIIQISACIFVALAQSIKKFLPNFDLRTWIMAGSAAGLAAAFNAPIAGMIFAIETIPQFHFEQKFAGFRIKAFFAVIVAGTASQYLTKSYTLFDFPTVHFLWEVKTCLLLLLIAAVCGVAIWILKETIMATAKWRNSITGNAWYLIPIAFGLLVATISVLTGHNSFGAGMFTIKETLLSTHSILTIQDSFGRFINIIASTAAGCAGGLVLPSLAVGASVGSLGSTLLPMVDARIFISTGMAAGVSAMLNAPLTAAVLIFEITNQQEFILPLFISSLVAAWIFKQCGSVYLLIKK